MALLLSFRVSDCISLHNSGLRLPLRPRFTPPPDRVPCFFVRHCDHHYQRCDAGRHRAGLLAGGLRNGAGCLPGDIEPVGDRTDEIVDREHGGSGGTECICGGAAGVEWVGGGEDSAGSDCDSVPSGAAERRGN